MLFYLSIIEYTDTFIGLHFLKKSAAMPMVCRALLEAYIDFKNMHDDPTYGFRLEAAQLKERLSILRNSRDSDNLYLNGLDEYCDQVAQWQSEFDSYEAKGHKPLNQYEKFKLAGKLHEYKAIYSDLCSHSHNNLSSLTQRHIDFRGGSDDVNIVVFDNYDPEKYAHLIQLVYICLMDSSARLYKTLP